LSCFAARSAAPQRAHSVSHSNPASASWVHEGWTAATGLPVNTVNAIIQSRTGYIWLTTYDGLVRFDGVRFTVYNTANSAGLTTNRLLGMSEASDGSLWIITEQYRLLRFREGRFTQLAADGVGDVQTTIEDAAGRVWVATTKGLGVVRGDSIVPVGHETLGGPVFSLIRRRNGTIWAGGRSGVGLYRVAPGDRVEKIAVDSALEADEIQVRTIGFKTYSHSGPTLG
jgi:ligand-binding sensor domain-containing protein